MNASLTGSRGMLEDRSQADTCDGAALTLHGNVHFQILTAEIFPGSVSRSPPVAGQESYRGKKTKRSSAAVLYSKATELLEPVHPSNENLLLFDHKQ